MKEMPYGSSRFVDRSGAGPVDIERLQEQLELSVAVPATRSGGDDAGPAAAVRGCAGCAAPAGRPVVVVPR